MQKTQEEIDNENEIKLFRTKKILKRVDAARPTGSVVTVILPPKKQVAEITKLLNDEMGKASCIKDRTNRNSVLEAQNSARERLKLYNRVPPNGLVLFCGLVMENDNKGERKITIDFQPHRPINLNVYSCGLNFQTNDLKKELLANDPPFGFIIVDGNGALYGTLQGQAKEVLTKFSVELPKKHRKGGQSSVRFSRLRVEKRHNYLRKVCEVAASCFLLNDRVTVAGLVLAGSADFKNELEDTQMFDARLSEKVVSVVDICYGGENGFNQAIELSQDSLENVKFVKEKKVISKFFDEIAMDSGLVCFGVEDTMKIVETGAVKKILIYDELPNLRLKLVNSRTGEEMVKYPTPQRLEELGGYSDSEGNPFDVKENEVLSEWLAENYKQYGTELELVSDRSAEGTQFYKGFGGMAGFLRYKLDAEHIIGEAKEWTEDDDDFM